MSASLGDIVKMMMISHFCWIIFPDEMKERIKRRRDRHLEGGETQSSFQDLAPPSHIQAYGETYCNISPKCTPLSFLRKVYTTLHHNRTIGLKFNRRKCSTVNAHVFAQRRQHAKDWKTISCPRRHDNGRCGGGGRVQWIGKSDALPSITWTVS